MGRSRQWTWLLVAVLSPHAQAALTVREPALGRNANENTCTVSQPSTRFQASHAEIFVAFRATGVAQGETLQIDWISPSGESASSIPYEGLPRAASLCFVSHLPVAGFAPSSQPGDWQLRVTVNGRIAVTKTFRIEAEANTGAARIDAITRTSQSANAAEFTLDGSAFSPGAVVHIAKLQDGGWRYIHAVMPAEASANRIRISTPALNVGEYLVVIRDDADRVSNSLRFVIASRESYKLPLPAGEPWMLTQGPYGGFSHYGQALHAFDIAPVGARCLVAMRGGIVYAFDRGLGQSHSSRTFGNYITIDHGDGEFSHYAHLASRSFVVKTGQRVEQGQALAIAGNSGYTFPWGGGHHVHVHVTRSFSISSQSIPFEFDDLKQSPRHRGVVMSSNRSPNCDCRKPVAAPVMVLSTTFTAPPSRPGAKTENGEVAVEQWWNQFLTVNPGVKTVDVSLVWTNPDADLDLHLVSPSGKHYGWYGNVAGYSGQDGQPERFEIANPEPGKWRIAVQGRRAADGSPVPFRIESFTSYSLATTSTR